MGKVYLEIDDRLRAFIEAQRMFFVATAPSGDGGHVNLSPKGLDSLRVLDSRRVAYLDYVGSGAETIAHLRENGRITLMLCAFDGPPRIVRLQGHGRVVEPRDDAFGALRARFDPKTPPRSVICVELERISDSCGYGVPLYGYEGERTQLVAWADRKGADAVLDYQRANNARSIDGLPALRWVEEPD